MKRTFISVKELKKILDQLEDTDVVSTNYSAYSLSVFRDREVRMIGLIDFEAKVIDLIEEE